MQQDVSLVNFSGRGARIRTGQPLRPGTLVRLDVDQTMMLGEVCYSEPDGEGFAAGLKLEHTLLQTESLERLRRRFVEEEQEDRLFAAAN